MFLTILFARQRINLIRLPEPFPRFSALCGMLRGRGPLSDVRWRAERHVRRTEGNGKINRDCFADRGVDSRCERKMAGATRPVEGDFLFRRDGGITVGFRSCLPFEIMKTIPAELILPRTPGEEETGIFGAFPRRTFTPGDSKGGPY